MIDPSTSRPVLSISEAAHATGKSRRTLGRLLDTGRLTGAHRDPEGTWRIPVESLIAAGLSLHAPSPADEPGPEREAAPTDPVAMAALEREVAEWRRRAEVAEAVAAERAAALDDVRAALALAQRMLGPGAETPAGAAGTPAGAPVTRRDESSWWSRLWNRR